MCEYCGCQAVTAVAELTREHDEVVALISRVRSARGVGDVAKPAELARSIATVLEPHTMLEEQGLFPAALSYLDADDWAAVDAVRDRAGSGLSAAG